jgi:phenylalanyl-tRNA synthetase beta chain
MDFSIVVPACVRYADVADTLRAFAHPLLKRLGFVSAYEGESLGAGRRSLTFRTLVGHDRRTLEDKDANDFRQAFEQYLTDHGFTLRR